MNQVENFLDTGEDSYVGGQLCSRQGPNIHKDETELDASTLRKLQVTLHGGF